MANRLGTDVSCHARLDVELNKVPFQVSTKGGSTLISFKKFSDALKVVKRTKAILKQKKVSIEAMDEILSGMGVTVCIQNHYFRILGQNSKPIYHKFFGYLIS